MAADHRERGSAGLNAFTAQRAAVVGDDEVLFRCAAATAAIPRARDTSGRPGGGGGHADDERRQGHQESRKDTLFQTRGWL